MLMLTATFRENPTHALPDMLSSILLRLVLSNAISFEMAPESDQRLNSTYFKVI